MKRVKLDRVIASTERLRRVGVNRQGNWLPGFLCLKANGVGPGSSRELAGTDFADFIDKYYLVPEAPDRSKPYFDPLADPPWKNANWPRGTFTSRNDRSLLIAKGVLTVTPQARLRTYELQPGYEIELARSVPPNSAGAGDPGVDGLAELARVLADYIAAVRRYAARNSSEGTD